MQLHRTLLLGALLGLLFTSCSKDSDRDTTRPTISILTPAPESTHAPGATVPFSAQLTDEGGLNSYKIDIHSASGHTHKSPTSDWNFQQEFSIGGATNYPAQRELSIPTDATPGEYHIVVYCTDLAGNEQMAYTEIIVTE